MTDGQIDLSADGIEQAEHDETAHSQKREHGQGFDILAAQHAVVDLHRVQGQSQLYERQKDTENTGDGDGGPATLYDRVDELLVAPPVPCCHRIAAPAAVNED